MSVLGLRCANGDLVGAEEALRDAYSTDVRQTLREWRESKGIDPEPFKAFRKSGYLDKMAAERTKRRAAEGAPAAMASGFPT